MRATIRPTLRDWLLLVIGSTFTLTGVGLVIAGKGGGAAIPATLFFGACTVVAIRLLRDKLGAGAPAAARELLTRLQAGEALVPLRGRKFVAAGTLLGLGLALLATGGAIGPQFMAVSGALAIGGAGLLTALLLGWQAGHATRFTREGLVMDTPTSRYLAPWTAIAAIDLAELNSSAVVRLRFVDPAAVVATLTARRGPVAVQRKRLERSFAWSMRFADCHLMFIPAGLDVDPVALFEALRRYLGEAGLRDELPAAQLGDSQRP